MTAAFEWGAAMRALPGETECGDAYVVETFENGALVAMIDALGHGPAAARAAGVAAQVLSRHSREEPAALIERCHASLRGTRGAAVSVAALDTAGRTLTWVGIGNVAGILVRAAAGGKARELMRYGGVVGDRLPDFSPSVVAVAAGDTLILTTDGVASYSPPALRTTGGAQGLAEQILGSHAKRTDDAAVLVLRLNGEG